MGSDFNFPNASWSRRLRYRNYRVGPAFIGFIARIASLEVAFAIVAAALVLVAVSGKRVTG